MFSVHVHGQSSICTDHKLARNPSYSQNAPGVESQEMAKVRSQKEGEKKSISAERGKKELIKNLTFGKVTGGPLFVVSEFAESQNLNKM